MQHPPLWLKHCILLLYSTAAFNDCYSKIMPYTVLPYSYWVSFHDVYQCQGHAYRRYRLQLPYNSSRTCLTNHMGFISCHITPLVINGLRGGHTHKHAHTHIRTETILRNQAPMRAWFNKTFSEFLNHYSTIMISPFEEIKLLILWHIASLLINTAKF